MPEIELIPLNKYQPLDPYHHEFDNLPVDALATRLSLVNLQVDNDADILRESIGTAGTLSNRLNQSINANGSLKTTAIDDAIHSVAEHTDTNTYVRMLKTERDKLSLVDAEATNLSVEVETISTTEEYPDAANTISIGPSPTITWRLDGAVLKADTVAPLSNHHIHLYDIEPVTTDDLNFTTTTVSTPYTSGSLRVYVNGLRLIVGGPAIGGFYFTETTPTSGTFKLNTALGSSDIIRIDFNQPLT